MRSCSKLLFFTALRVSEQRGPLRFSVFVRQRRGLGYSAGASVKMPRRARTMSNVCTQSEGMWDKIAHQATLDRNPTGCYSM